MFKIINADTGETIGSTEKPRYIKKQVNGCFGQTDEKHAQGIAYQSTPYALKGREGLGVEATVMLVEFDDGATVAQVAEHSAAIDEIIVSMLEG